MKYQGALSTLFSKWNVQGAYISGDEFWCCCPFHGERRAAFSVNLDTGKWNCLACHKRGRTITELVAAIEGISTARAEDVLERFGVGTIQELKQEIRENLRAHLETHTDKKGKDTLSTNEWKRTDGMIAPYLTKRGFSEDILREFHVGFDKASKVITIPVFEHRTCRFVYTRITWKKANHKLPSYHYPKGVDKSFYLWGMTESVDSYDGRTIFLTEGGLDALWLRQHGYCAFAILGSYISWDQVRRIEDMNPGQVILAFDNDRAGFDCTLSAGRMLMKQGFGECYYLRYPKGVNDPQEAHAGQLERMVSRKRSVRPLVWGATKSRRMAALLAS